ncbi:type II toxin-antitoxin system VapC family toxin [Haliscomenobacter hydrossis]|uniref:PilT protein domain protein n=1 Tax=Haliscomenobacter hydrossis (strain ATCC 27775 / DSM 1100 / LMG 10767 / O) TaxID=760192 RepID=F4KW89_HALH1|nr:PIN domain-containing protein [Haliscomenobacter hydrossis]AEE49277.1 PilT protein domain protein [Haliscomenobacter hydrossis DSM 1100]
MKTEVLLDTNILLYALDSGNPYHAQAVLLLEDSALRFSVTTKNIAEYFAVCSKLKVPLAKAIVFYHSLCENAQVLFPNEASLLIFEQLIQKYNPIGNRVFDMEIVSVALVYGISIIVTVNTKDFDAIDEITVRSLTL